jgi:hypothetical protein
VNIVVPVEADFEWTNIFPPEKALLWVFWCQELNGGSIGTVGGVLLPVMVRRADLGLEGV